MQKDYENRFQDQTPSSQKFSESSSLRANFDKYDFQGELKDEELAYLLTRHFIFASHREKSYLVEETEKFLTENKFSFKKQVMMYPFYFEFLVESEGKHFALNFMGAHNMMNVRIPTLFEELK